MRCGLQVFKLKQVQRKEKIGSANLASNFTKFIGIQLLVFQCQFSNFLSQQRSHYRVWKGQTTNK